MSVHKAWRHAAAVLATLAVAIPATASAEGWKPRKRVEIVLGTSAADGGLNRNVRLIREWLVRDKVIPESSIVVNKPGGGHALALTYTASQVGSAETIQLVNTPLITNNLLGRSPITYKDFTPIALLYDETVVFTVPTKSGIANAQTLIDRLKRDPASVVFSTATGLGTVQHIATLALAKSVGVDIKSGKLKTVNGRRRAGRSPVPTARRAGARQPVPRGRHGPVRDRLYPRHQRTAPAAARGSGRTAGLSVPARQRAADLRRRPSRRGAGAVPRRAGGYRRRLRPRRSALPHRRRRHGLDPRLFPGVRPARLRHLDQPVPGGVDLRLRRCRMPSRRFFKRVAS